MNATSKRPFPLLPPGSTSEAPAIRGNDWSAFQQLVQLEDHWTLKAWPPGRAGFYWYLTFDDPALSALARACQSALPTDDIDLVPPDGLHITLMGIGSTDEVSTDDLAEIIGITREKLSSVEPFDLCVGPLSGSRSAIRFSVAPWDQLLELHRLLRACTLTLRPGTHLAMTSEFRPHLGIGYINRPQHSADLVSAVAALRRLPTAKVSVDKIDLVELRRNGRQYQWQDRTVLSLGT
ncbi:2'-5' RNA ligase family protein [Nocardia sp. NPDC049707]|uniref:2'-5' RNA ligase family protein n=1 Tax=Nocardia sp. NPDC049707 TaxID=3154735 RepID=UPI00343E7C0D